MADEPDDLLAEIEDLQIEPDALQDCEPEVPLAAHVSAASRDVRTSMSDATIVGDDTSGSLCSIHEDFFRVYPVYRSIAEEFGCPSEKEMQKAITMVDNLRIRVDRERLFSRGETLDDIPTPSLKYAMVPLFLSELFTLRDPPHRSKWLRISDVFAKQFLDFCEKWEIMTKAEQKSYDRSFGDGKDIPKKAIETRNEAIEKRKADIQTDALLDRLRQSVKYNAKQTEENEWCLFDDDEEMEREYWIQCIHKGIRQSMKTLGQNAFERPLAQISDEKAEIAELKEFEKNYSVGGDPALLLKKQEKLKEIEAKHKEIFEQDSKGDGLPPSSNPWVQVIEKDGTVHKFDSLDQYGQSLGARIDDLVASRTDRTKVFRDPNPWVYTASEAAEYGLLPEIPKDYDAKQKARRMAERMQRLHGHRQGRSLADEERDDGTRLVLDEPEYTMRGGVKTIRMQDMPPDPTEKHVDDLTEEELEAKRKEDEYWASWKDDHQRGVGNPYYN